MNVSQIGSPLMCKRDVLIVQSSSLFKTKVCVPHSLTHSSTTFLAEKMLVFQFSCRERWQPRPRPRGRPEQRWASERAGRGRWSHQWQSGKKWGKDRIREKERHCDLWVVVVWRRVVTRATYEKFRTRFCSRTDGWKEGGKFSKEIEFFSWGRERTQHFFSWQQISRSTDATPLSILVSPLPLNTQKLRFSYGYTNYTGPGIKVCRFC